MEITIGSKVKHTPSGHILTVTKIKRVFLIGDLEDSRLMKTAEVRIADCTPHVEPPKEKSFYDKMRERNMEDAKKLAPTPKEVGQHILWLKMAVIDRVEKIENLTNGDIFTFRSDNKFGFTEPYVNLLMHYAYEAGKESATKKLESDFRNRTGSMKNAIDSIIKALDDNSLLPDDNCNCDY